MVPLRPSLPVAVALGLLLLPSAASVGVGTGLACERQAALAPGCEDWQVTAFGHTSAAFVTADGATLVRSGFDDDGTTVEARRADTGALQWTATLPGTRLYVRGATGGNVVLWGHTPDVRALALADGTPAWTYAPPPGHWVSLIAPDAVGNTYAAQRDPNGTVDVVRLDAAGAATPVVAGIGVAFFGLATDPAGNLDLLVLHAWGSPLTVEERDATGALLWSAAAPSIRDFAGFQTDPGGHLLLHEGSSHAGSPPLRVHRLDGGSGAHLWSATPGAGFNNGYLTKAARGDHLVFAHAADATTTRVTDLDLATGAVRWTADLAVPTVADVQALGIDLSPDGSRVLVLQRTGGQWGNPPTWARTVSLDSVSGDVQWSATAGADDFLLSGHVLGTPHGPRVVAPHYRNGVGQITDVLAYSPDETPPLPASATASCVPGPGLALSCGATVGA